jgi:long-chain fatty acid transport protein
MTDPGKVMSIRGRFGAANNRVGIGLLATAMVPCLCTHVNAVGLRDPNLDPEAIARGDAFTATADNPAAIYYNPAGITQLQGNNLRVGVYLISPDTRFTSPTDIKAETDSTYQAVPQGFYVYSPENFPLSFGLGVYEPFGLSQNWGKNTPFTSLAESGEILYLAFEPVVAWRVTSNLSVAVGPTINYSRATLNQGILGVPGGQFKFDGDGVDFGVNAGVRWQPIQQLAFGLSYHSPNKMEYKGDSQTLPSPPLPKTASTTASAQYPQFIVGGISIRPTEKWNLEFDLDWTDWDTLDKVVFRGTGFGNIPLAFNYQSSFMYEFGVTRQLGKGYFGSVGYIYSENSIPDKHYNPLVPDAELHLGSVGFGHHGLRWDWAVSYHFAYGDREVLGDQAPMANGHYQTFNNAFDIAATFKF